jgi:hypothetical protein
VAHALALLKGAGPGPCPQERIGTRACAWRALTTLTPTHTDAPCLPLLAPACPPPAAACGASFRPHRSEQRAAGLHHGVSLE